MAITQCNCLSFLPSSPFNRHKHWSPKPVKTKPNTGLFSSSSGSEIWPMLLPPMPKLQMSTNPSALLNMSWGTPTSYRAPRGRFSLAWHGVLQCSWYSWPTGSPRDPFDGLPHPRKAQASRPEITQIAGHHHPIPALVSQKSLSLEKQCMHIMHIWSYIYILHIYYTYMVHNDWYIIELILLILFITIVFSFFGALHPIHSNWRLTVITESRAKAQCCMRMLI